MDILLLTYRWPRIRPKYFVKFEVRILGNPGVCGALTVILCIYAVNAPRLAYSPQP
jgi:hypothetical protein